MRISRFLSWLPLATSLLFSTAALAAYDPQALPIYNVQLFGGNGNGNADNTSALVAAVATVSSTGGTIYFPCIPGSCTYAFKTLNTPAITIAANASAPISIQCDKGAVILMNNMSGGNATSDAIKIMAPNNNITIRDCAIQWITQSAAVTGFAGIDMISNAVSLAVTTYSDDTDALISAQSFTNIVIEGNTILHSPSVGMGIDAISQSRIVGNYINDTLADGIFLERTKSSVIANNTLNNTGDDGISLHRTFIPANISAASVNGVTKGADGLSYTWTNDDVISGNYIGPQNSNPISQGPTSAGLVDGSTFGAHFVGNTVNGKARGYRTDAGNFSLADAFLASQHILVTGLNVYNAANCVKFYSHSTSPYTPNVWPGDFQVSNVNCHSPNAQSVSIVQDLATDGWWSGIKIDGYKDFNSTGGASAVWNILRCQSCSFSNFSTDEAINYDTGLTGNPNTFSLASNLTMVNGTANHFVLAGISQADRCDDLTSSGSTTAGFAFNSTGNLSCGTLNLINPASGQYGITDDANSKDIHIQNYRVYVGATSGFGEAASFTSGGDIWIDNTEITYFGANTNAPFCTGCSNARLGNWKYKAYATDSNWHYCTQGTGTLVGGALSVSTACYRTDDLIILDHNTPGGTTGTLYTTAQSAGSGFTIDSASASDTSTVFWKLLPGGN